MSTPTDGDFQFDDLFVSSSPRKPGNPASNRSALTRTMGFPTDDFDNEEDVVEYEEAVVPDEAEVALDSPDEAHAANLRESVPMIPSLTLDAFTMLTVVGKGAYGKVRQVLKKDTNEIYAMKTLHKKHLIDSDCVENTMAEKDILRKVRHPFVVRLHYAFQTPSKLYLVMDFVNGGHLLHHLVAKRMFRETEARFYIAEVILALEHLHSLDIIHRDLKPENVLVDSDGHCVLTDFGFAKENVTDPDSCKSFCGTLEYMAPEVIKKNRYGKPADWWSVGILLYDMLNGHPPFQSPNDKTLFGKILNDRITLPKYLTRECCNLLNGLLERSINRRLTVEKIKAHPFFRQINWDSMMAKNVRPPIIPKVKQGIMDTSNFDAALTKQDEGDSPASSLTSSMQSRFLGFSYVKGNSFDESCGDDVEEL